MTKGRDFKEEKVEFTAKTTSSSPSSAIFTKPNYFVTIYYIHLLVLFKIVHVLVQSNKYMISYIKYDLILNRNVIILRFYVKQ